MNIKTNETIDGYNIGSTYKMLLNDYKKGKLSHEQTEKLRSIGIDITLGKQKRNFQMKMDLARQAVNEGIIITKNNKSFKGYDFYQWYQTNKNKFTYEELAIMNKLIPNRHTKKVAIISIKNGDINIYHSMAEAGRALYFDFHIVNTEESGISTINNRLSGRIKNPIYKGRFRFEYAEDEEPLKEKSPTIKKASL